jgi:4-amino-4-deoxy-L-arabinose transferase-like glycosyltransferase
MATIKRHRPILAILVIFLALGVAYSVVTPLFESPDEVWHYEYVRWLVEGHGLPTPQEVGTAPWHQEGSQPPLYYLVAALVTKGIPTDNAGAVIRYNPHAAVGQADAPGNKNVMVHGSFDAWPWQGVVLAAHVARLLSLLFGMVTVLSAYGVAVALFPRNRYVHVLAASLVAFNPQFIFISSSVTNITLVTASCAAGVWFSVHLLDKYARGDRARAAGSPAVPRPAVFGGPTLLELLLLGAVAGIAALSQLSGIALSGLVGLTVLLIAWRRRARFSHLLAWLVVLGAGVFAVAGWWYLRNLVLYHDPLGLQAMFDVLPKRAARPTVAELMGRAQGVWRSMWAVFGWFNVLADNWVYTVYSALALIGLAGLIFAAPVRWLLGRRRQHQPDGRTSRSSFPFQFLLLLIWIAVMLLAVFAWTQMRYPQGRLLFPALAAAAGLVAFGLASWLPRKLQWTVGSVLPAGLGALALIAPFAWIAPAYAPPALLSSTAAVSNSSSVEFGDQLRLVGYELGQTQVQAGSPLPLTLYWQAINRPAADYSIFVHLLDENGTILAQHDSYPAAGSLPTTEWPAAATIPDRHTVDIPSIALKSPQLTVEVGVYDYRTGQRLVANGADTLKIGEVQVAQRTSPDGVPNPVQINFENQIALTGFDFDRATMRPGESLELKMWWQALGPLKHDYVAFAHLVYPPDAVWAGSDRAPASGWGGGVPITESYGLKLPPEAPAGVYFIEVGLYDPKTLTRLKVDGSDKGILLGYVEVQ